MGSCWNFEGQILHFFDLVCKIIHTIFEVRSIDFHSRSWKWTLWNDKFEDPQKARVLKNMILGNKLCGTSEVVELRKTSHVTNFQGGQKRHLKKEPKNMKISLNRLRSLLNMIAQVGLVFREEWDLRVQRSEWNGQTEILAHRQPIKVPHERLA